MALSPRVQRFEIKTPPALVRMTSNNWLSHCMIFEIEDEDEADLESHDLQYNRLTDSKIYHGSSIAGVAANGSLPKYLYLIFIFIFMFIGVRKMTTLLK